MAVPHHPTRVLSRVALAPPRPLPAGALSKGVLFDLAVLPKLHVNVCGYFTLLAKKDWESLRGYPEWVVHSWHLDTIFLHQAARFPHEVSSWALLRASYTTWSMRRVLGGLPWPLPSTWSIVQQRGMRTLDVRWLRKLKRQFLWNSLGSCPLC